MRPENLALDHSHSRCSLGTVYTAQTYMGKCHLPPLGLRGGSKQNYSTSSDNHLVSMMQAFVIFGMQYCNVLGP